MNDLIPVFLQKQNQMLHVKSLLWIFTVFKLISKPLLPTSPRLELIVVNPEVLGRERGNIKSLVCLEYRSTDPLIRFVKNRKIKSQV
jgi:hypothetical protein